MNLFKRLAAKIFAPVKRHRIVAETIEQALPKAKGGFW